MKKAKQSRLGRIIHRLLVDGMTVISLLLVSIGIAYLSSLWLDEDVLMSVRILVIGILILLGGLLFRPLRRLFQKWVDRLFYGKSSQPSDIIGAVSKLLAGCLSRRELNQVLTRNVPDMLRLSGAKFWFGEAAYAPTLKLEEPHLAFELTFQAKVRAIWTLLSHQSGRPFSGDEKRQLALIAEQAEVALRNVLLVETLRRRLDEIRSARELLAEAQHQLLRSRERERSRLARDLHDGPIQSLVALNLSIGLLDFSGKMDQTALLAELNRIRGDVKALISDLRGVCAELRPPLLDTLGLAAALESLVSAWAEENQIPADAVVEKNPARYAQLPDDVTVNLYRIVQEALHNIGKHARASHVSVSLEKDDSTLKLCIVDDGAGFAVPETYRDLTQGGHFGLVGMRERVNLIGGQWSLESSPGTGTRIEIHLPCEGL